MIKRIVFIASFLFFHLQVFACDTVDDSGKALHLQQPAKRIISLSPDLTEILFSIGAGKKIVGVMRGSDFPSQARQLPIVADYQAMDREAIVILHPDLVVTWSDYRPAQQLKKFSIPIYVSHPKQLTDIPKTIRRLGCLVGDEKTAEKVAKQFEEHYQILKTKYIHARKVRVFYQVWSKPLVTVTQNSWINDVISLCGGQNIFANLSGVSPEVNVEAVIAMNPDVIVGLEMSHWAQWKILSAVRSHQIYSLNTDLIERAGPRILDGAEAMCHILDEERNNVIRK
jgi:iron complex transport system substrate-binding protein